MPLSLLVPRFKRFRSLRKKKSIEDDSCMIDLPDDCLLTEYLRAHGFNDWVIGVLKRHEIDMDLFPSLDANDLRDMGFFAVGLRKRLLNLIEELKDSRTVHSIDSVANFSSQTALPDIPSPSHKLEQGHTALFLLILSFSYAVLAFGITSFVMVIVHERLPEVTKYPPLPDILLDNLPYVPWAFEAAELLGVILSLIWTFVLILHKHRFILLRRHFSLLGTTFILRSITMFITSLSVPGRHLEAECKPFVFANSFERTQRALEIWLGFGMTLRGVRTCGDYMFSGHTTFMILLNFFITEYTPRRFFPLHIFTWILTVFGVFFILAAHEHYSIDVFIAIYISSRLFLYYHALANNNSLMQRDRYRIRIWFPLFNLFEDNVHGVVPNVFENPLRYKSFKEFLQLSAKETFPVHGPFDDEDFVH